jgi:DNA-directed RNA polymerase specialized sigma24 family protein
MTMYDAAIGRVEKGQEYLIEEDKAERWVYAGVATEVQARSKPPPAAEPEPEEDDDEEGEAEVAEPGDELRRAAVRLSEEGLPQRTIAERLGISRHRVRALLAG